MEVEPFENPWIKKIRVLTQLLLLSIVLNIGLTTAFVTHKVRASRALRPQNAPSKRPKIVVSNAQVIKSLFSYSFEELVGELDNRELVQDGYSRRDLALSCLVSYHHLDMKRALIGKEFQVRKYTFVHTDGGEQFDLEVYPALDESDFQLIQNFLKREKWPLTTEGLFEELKKESAEPNLTTSLAQTFVSTSEFYTLYTLFRRKSDHVKASEVLQMILEGPWNFFNEFITLQKASPNLTEVSMRDLLTKYVEYGVPTASLLWIKLDGEFALRGLDDQLLKKVVSQIQVSNQQVTLFLKQLLWSARSDGLRELAGKKLYTFENLSIPEPYSHELTVRQFIPEMAAREAEVISKKEEAHQVILHTVCEGESLWKIAKKYQTSISEIRRVNKLKNDKLRLGQIIEIPVNK